MVPFMNHDWITSQSFLDAGRSPNLLEDLGMGDSEVAEAGQACVSVSRGGRGGGGGGGCLWVVSSTSHTEKS